MKMDISIYVLFGLTGVGHQAPAAISDSTISSSKVKTAPSEFYFGARFTRSNRIDILDGILNVSHSPIW